MSSVTQMFAAGWTPEREPDGTGEFHADPDDTEWPVLRPVLERAENDAPRSHQWEIGPSEMGTTCVHCLAARLAGWEKVHNDSAPLQPYIGTAAHAFNQKSFDTLDDDRYRTEYPVRTCNLRMPGGRIMRVGGHIDLWDTQTATTVDWKFVGKWTWDRAARGITSQSYRIQASLYGIGLANEGHAPKRSTLVFFNRANGRTFKDGVTTLGWDWEEQPGRWAIARCRRILYDLGRLEQIGGTQLRDRWISELPRADFCYSCADYPDWHGSHELHQKPDLPEFAWDEIRGIPAIYIDTTTADSNDQKED